MQGFTCFRALVVELDDALFAAIAIPCTKYPVSQEALVVAVVAAVVAVGVRLPLSLCLRLRTALCSGLLALFGAQAPLPCLDLPTSDKLGLGFPIQGQEAQIKQPVWICPPQTSWD